MCDLKPGDEVECVDDRVRPAFFGEEMLVTKGGFYIVESVLWDDLYSEAGVTLQGIISTGYMGGFAASRFRKVQRRNSRLTIEAFSVIKDGQFEEPKRTTAPAKTREKA